MGRGSGFINCLNEAMLIDTDFVYALKLANEKIGRKNPKFFNFRRHVSTRTRLEFLFH